MTWSLTEHGGPLLSSPVKPFTRVRYVWVSRFYLRIAIMAEGELRCMGSSLFLKGLYGVGYTLTVIRKDYNEKIRENDFDGAYAQDPGGIGQDVGEGRYTAGVGLNGGDNNDRGSLMVSLSQPRRKVVLRTTNRRSFFYTLLVPRPPTY